MVKGEAARSFTRMFLHMWYLDEKAPDFDTFLNVPAKQQAANGFVMPYGDCPLAQGQGGRAGLHGYAEPGPEVCPYHDAISDFGR